MEQNNPFTAPADISDSIEETKIFAPTFNADGLIPAIVTDHKSGSLLMMAWMNEEALHKTIDSGDAWYWSRSRRELWRKGATSGNTQRVVELRTDCDQDALQLVVEQTGPACHTKRARCFYRLVVSDGDAVKLTPAKD